MFQRIVFIILASFSCTASAQIPVKDGEFVQERAEFSLRMNYSPLDSIASFSGRVDILPRERVLARGGVKLSTSTWNHVGMNVLYEYGRGGGAGFFDEISVSQFYFFAEIDLYLADLGDHGVMYSSQVAWVPFSWLKVGAEARGSGMLGTEGVEIPNPWIHGGGPFVQLRWKGLAAQLAYYVQKQGEAVGGMYIFRLIGFLEL